MKQIFLLTLLFFSISVFAQNELTVPLEFGKAYKNNTRSSDGKPGFDYWQNHSEYKINAEFITATRTLKGSETIKYYNESPDTLSSLVLRLYQNINRPESSKDWDYDPNSFTNGVNITTIKINGETVNPENSIEHTATNIILKNILNPKSSVELYFEWTFDLPRGQSPRMGRYDSTSYLIAYWYPQMAVYDDIDGWDKIDYRGQVEFYNDFSDFDVNISIDNSNCIVWATGELQNVDEVFSKKFADIYKSNAENKIINFINSENSKEKILNTEKKPYWHYKASSVPDFAFAFSDHYYWDFTDYRNFSDKNNHNVRINTVYKPASERFKNVCDIAKNAIHYLSTELPGVYFPYPAMTVFNGDGGMEFPMMVNDAETDNLPSDVYLTSHEISHTYFPFYMGTNERKYAWMDEGWAVFLPQDFQTINSKTVDSRSRKVEAYLKNAGTLYDIPMMVLSNQLKSPSYRIAAYQKSSCSYDILKDILGEKVFKECLREYINRWNGKHPMPFDFFNTFKDVSGENLDWFFKPWYFEFGYPDLSLVSASENKGEWSVVIEKKGNYPVPVSLEFETAEGRKIEHYESAKVWSRNNRVITIKKDIQEKIVSIKLGNKYIPDINQNDNLIIINK